MKHLPFWAGVASVLVTIPVFGFLVMRLFDFMLNRAVRSVAR